MTALAIPNGTETRMSRDEAIRYLDQSRRHRGCLPKRGHSATIAIGVELYNVKGRYKLIDLSETVKAEQRRRQAAMDKRLKRKDLAIKLLRSCLEQAEPDEHLREDAAIRMILCALDDPQSDLCDLLAAAVRSKEIGAEDIISCAVVAYDDEARAAMDKADYTAMNQLSGLAHKIDNLQRELYFNH